MKALQLTYEALQRRIIKAGKRAGHVRSDSLQVLLEKLGNPSNNQQKDLQKSAQQIKDSKEFTNFMVLAYKAVEE